MIVYYIWIAYETQMDFTGVWTSSKVFSSEDKAEADLKRWLTECIEEEHLGGHLDEEDIKISKEDLANMDFNAVLSFAENELNSQTTGQVRAVKLD